LRLAWLAYLWNEQRLAGLAQGDEIARLTANMAQLEQVRDQATNELAAAAAELETTQARLAQSDQDLQAKTDALAAKESEFNDLQASTKVLQARVDELQGYRDRARAAITAVMPEPTAPADPQAPAAVPALP
jgi:chromosome segregation ATPase